MICIGVFFSSIVMCLYFMYGQISDGDTAAFLQSGTVFLNFMYISILMFFMWIGSTISKEVK